MGAKFVPILITLALFIVQYNLWFVDYVDLGTFFVSLFILTIQVVGSIYAYKAIVGFDKFDREGLSLKRKK